MFEINERLDAQRAPDGSPIELLYTAQPSTEERVAVVPGDAFGPSGAGHVRMCYATSYERLEEALARIGRFVERVRPTA